MGLYEAWGVIGGAQLDVVGVSGGGGEGDGFFRERGKIGEFAIQGEEIDIETKTLESVIIWCGDGIEA
jgi:hypothetical protein